MFTWSIVLLNESSAHRERLALCHSRSRLKIAVAYGTVIGIIDSSYLIENLKIKKKFIDARRRGLHPADGRTSSICNRFKNLIALNQDINVKMKKFAN